MCICGIVIPKTPQVILVAHVLCLAVPGTLILCSGKESCFHYVNGGGMEQLAQFLSQEECESTTVTLMLLGVVEQATRYSVGCEGLLGWWPREVCGIIHIGGFSGDGQTTTMSLSKLANARLQLRKLLKLINSSGWVVDPSPIACAVRSLMVASSEGALSFRATNKLIASSSCRFLQQSVDAKLLLLLKERGFLPLSIALLSSSELRAERGRVLDAFMDVTSSIEATLLSLMFCRSGLVFLRQHLDLSSTIIHAFKGDEVVNEFVPLRYASVLVSKGFFCRLQDVGINLEMHLRVVNATDRLLTSTPCSEELLWVLWELCGLSR
ncbi:ATP synthase subunit alpha 2 [Bienertia sinuspersici]